MISSGKDTIRFVIGNLEVGGTEIHLSRLLPRLVDEYSPVVITLTHKGALARELERAGIAVHEPAAWIRTLQKIPLISKVLGIPVTLLYLLRIYQSIPAVLTCFYLPGAYILGGIAACLAGEHRTVMFRRSLGNYKQGKPVAAMIEEWLHKKQLAIVGNSQAVLHDLVKNEKVDRDKLALLHNGINLPTTDREATRLRIRDSLAIGKDEIVLCCVANLIPYKGHMDLIEALSGIQKQIARPWRLLCVGSGLDSRPDLVERARTKGLDNRILWLGQREDIDDILSAADIGVLVSHQEGFSNSVLEGMASGLPMIVTDVGGNSEAIMEGETGILVRPGDPESIGAAILALVNDRKKSALYGEAARKRAMEVFSMDTCVNNYKLLFRGLNASPPVIPSRLKAGALVSRPGETYPGQ